MPSARYASASRSVRSASNCSRTLSPRWTIVTSPPAVWAMCANSNAMYPPPTNTTRRGSSRVDMNSSLSFISSSPGMPRTAGLAPVARMTCFAECTSPPTSTEMPSSSLETNLASPCIVVTPAERIQSSIRSGSPASRLSLNSTSSAQSSPTSPSTPCPRPARARSTVSATVNRVFFGSQPRRAHVPPNSRQSTRAT